MGIGLIVVCTPAGADRVLEILHQGGEPRAVRIGRIVAGDRRVTYL
jgi:phosphoribosylaminoimidazole (AIR) synthetase